MSKVRKIPVVVEAFHFKDVSCVDGLIAFVGEEHIEGYTDTEEPEKPIPLYHIKTLEGDMRVSEGDWIIKGVKGEFYPCKPDVFKQTYEVVDDNGMELDDLDAAKASVLKERSMHEYCTKQSCAELRRHLGIAANCIEIVRELVSAGAKFGRLSDGEWKVNNENGMNTTICDGSGMFIAECFALSDARHIVAIHNIWLRAFKQFGKGIDFDAGGSGNAGEKDKDALGALADRLGKIRTPPTFYISRDGYRTACSDIAASSRILGEIARVKCDGKGIPNWGDSSRAIAKCREIAYGRTDNA